MKGKRRERAGSSEIERELKTDLSAVAVAKEDPARSRRSPHFSPFASHELASLSDIQEERGRQVEVPREFLGMLDSD